MNNYKQDEQKKILIRSLNCRYRFGAPTDTEAEQRGTSGPQSKSRHGKWLIGALLLAVDRPMKQFE